MTRSEFTPSNHLAGVGAGRAPDFIEMMQVGVSLKSGSARLVGRLGHSIPLYENTPIDYLIRSSEYRSLYW